MPLAYNQEFTIDAKEIRCIDFSQNGEFLATGAATWIKVWDTTNGKQYQPIIEVRDPMCILWIDQYTFLVGLADGRLGTFAVDPSQEGKEMLSISLTGGYSGYITSLAYEEVMSSLATGGINTVKIWSRNREKLGGWDRDFKSLAYPVSDSHNESDKNVRVTALAWLSRDSLLAAYIDHGLIIWDVKSLSPTRIINLRSQIINGALCLGTKFAVTNGVGGVDVYDLQSSVICFAYSPHSISTLCAIHGGTALLVGGPGRADIVHIEDGYRTQVLFHVDENESTSNKLTALAGHYNKSSDQFQIATASSKRLILWKASEVGPNITSSSNNSGQKRFWNYLGLA